MAQKFTVDPRLLAAVSGGGASSYSDADAEDEDDAEVSDLDEEDAAVAVIKPTAVKASETRGELLERLAKEYEAEQAAANAAAAAGDGCLMCGS